MFDFISFLRRKWTEYSQSSGQQGTLIDDLAVKPTGLIMADFYNAHAKQRRINDIRNWESMSDDEVDFFGNKFFIPRIYGDFAYGYVRIYFDQKSDIEISQSFRASAGTGKKYRPIQPTYISKSSFKNSSDGFALYYVDVPIIAESRGNAYNVLAGEIAQLEGVDFTYKMVTNPESITRGSKSENKEEYVKRLKYSINDRSMMNRRSIIAQLPQFFPSLNTVYVSSSGDKYMSRDLVEAVDVSMPSQKIDFLGKLKGENVVKNVAFSGIYPPEAGNVHGSFKGPFSIPTNYPFWLTIDPSDLLNSDPAYHGYPIDQEVSDDMYKGIFFDDFKTFMNITTTDLFNIYDEGVGFVDQLSPSEDWIYGAVGLRKGDFGILPSGLKSGDLVKFNYNTIKLCAGSPNSISIGKDIKKRVGVKLTGTFIWPEINSQEDLALRSNLQFLIGGADDSFVEGYTGIGFGVRLNKMYEAGNHNNAIVYFSHSAKYGTSHIYATQSDYSNSLAIIGDVSALAEYAFQVEPGLEYEFEYVLYDDLQMSILISKVNPTPGDTNEIRQNLSSTPLRSFSGQILNKDSTYYGTRMKVTLDTKSTDNSKSWQINDLKAFDIAEYRATALFSFNVKDLDSPASLFFRGSGNGAVGGTPQPGYSVYIWDRENITPASNTSELTNGGWSLLSDVSNSDGSKDIASSLLESEISNLDRYITNSRFGESIFILVAATGTSAAQIKFSGSLLDDVQSSLNIDYIKMESSNSNQYHANNKSDIHVVTTKNSETITPVSVVLSKNINDSFFYLSGVPIKEIVSVSVGSEVIAESEYVVTRVDENFSRSSREEVRIYLNQSSTSTITVQYIEYPDIVRMQEFFDSSEYGKVFGDMLVRHKSPVNLNIPIFFTGDISDDQLISEINKYVDQNIDGKFSIKDFVSYLYNNKFVNNVKEPIEITYDDGSFTDILEISDIEYFQVQSVSVNRL